MGRQKGEKGDAAAADGDALGQMIVRLLGLQRSVCSLWGIQRESVREKERERGKRERGMGERERGRVDRREKRMT